MFGETLVVSMVHSSVTLVDVKVLDRVVAVSYERFSLSIVNVLTQKHIKTMVNG